MQTDDFNADREQVQDVRASASNDESEAAHSGSEDGLYEALADGIVSHVLAPGMRLKEELLAEVFGVGRTVLRPVLRRLAHEGLVVILPRRGAHVALPPVEEAREVFAARRVIEAGLLEQCTRPLDEGSLARLRAQLDAEDAARARGDENALVRISGEFHLILAEMAGNGPLLRTLRDLLARSVLATAIYQPSSEAGCRTDHHRVLLGLLENGANDAAARFMTRHVWMIENDLDFDAPIRKASDSRSVLDALKSLAQKHRR